MEEKQLLKDLLSDNPELRQTATLALWNLWLGQAGEIGEFRIRKGTKIRDIGQHELAQKEFEDLVVDYPKFAEAHNTPKRLPFDTKSSYPEMCLEVG